MVHIINSPKQPTLLAITHIKGNNIMNMYITYFMNNNATAHISQEEVWDFKSCTKEVNKVPSSRDNNYCLINKWR